MVLLAPSAFGLFSQGVENFFDWQLRQPVRARGLDAARRGSYRHAAL